MSDDSVLRQGAAEWLRFAAEDLAYAREGLKSTYLSTGVACFHAQQAAEKSIKAVLVVSGSEVPRIHDLERLLALLPAATKSSLPKDVAWLTPYSVAHRYPGEDEPPTRENLTHAVAVAEGTLEWAGTIIG